MNFNTSAITTSAINCGNVFLDNVSTITTKLSQTSIVENNQTDEQNMSAVQKVEAIQKSADVDPAQMIRDAIFESINTSKSLFECLPSDILEKANQFKSLHLGKGCFEVKNSCVVYVYKYSEIMAALANIFPNIEELHFEVFSKTDEICQYLNYFKNLKILDFIGTDITGENFKHLPNSVTELSFADCYQLNDYDKKTKQINKNLSFQHLIKLEKLAFRSTTIQGPCFQFLPESLKILSCRNNPLIDEGLAYLKDKHLIDLDISNSYHIMGKYFGNLPRTLQTLNCDCCEELQDGAIANLFHTQLKSLHLDSTTLQDPDFSRLPRTIKILSCDHCQYLSIKARMRAVKLRELGATVSCFASW
jgi:hypothetical protein